MQASLSKTPRPDGAIAAANFGLDTSASATSTASAISADALDVLRA